MFPPFPQFTAHHYIQKLIDDLDCGKVKIQQITEVSKERLGSGIMLGCLLAYDKKTTQRIILFALSGISRQLIFADSGNPYEITTQGEKFIIKELNKRNIQKVDYALFCAGGKVSLKYAKYFIKKGTSA